nr:hypothetical protein [Tanacetum cinerariifolium]
MSKGISLTLCSIPTRHTNKKLAQTRLPHRHNLTIFVVIPTISRFWYAIRKNNPFQDLQKQPEAFQQSQPKLKFKEPQPSKDNCKGKRVAKRATVDLVDEDEEEEEHIRQCAHWTPEEEILLTECWIETSENGQIETDRTDDSFWGQIMDDPSGENEADHIEAVKVTFAAQQPKGRKFQLEHAWRILKGHSEWNAPKPLDTEDHTDILGLIRGSALGSISDFVYEDLRRKLQAGTSAYEAKKQEELAMMEFKEMEFLTIDADKLSEPKASIIRNRQEKIIAKYAQE